MKECHDIEPLLTPYVDGEIDAPEVADVRAHLARCGPCRAAEEAERRARVWVRENAASLRGTAPSVLATKCRQLCSSPQARSRWFVPAAVAASVAVLLGGSMVLLLSNERRALAAELSADHQRCFASSSSAVPSTAFAVGDRTVEVPAGDTALGLELTGVRACRIRRVLMAHALYRCQGRPVSLYVAQADELPAIPAIMGAEVRTWTGAEQCYALVGEVTGAEMDRIEQYVRAFMREHDHVEVAR